MKVKVPKTERKRQRGGRVTRILRRVIMIAIVFVLMALAGMQILAYFTGNDTLKTPGNGVATLITPLQSAFSSAVNWVVDYLYTLKLRSNIELAYNELKQQNEQLAYNAMLVAELQHKLSAYENLYDEVSENELMNPLVATVVGRESENYFSVFNINKGSNDGVEPYMAVTMDGALVGYTESVTATRSVVRAIIDSEASIAALISSSRDQGTVRGTLGVDGTAMCRMYYLPVDNLPRPGDLVVTSGVAMGFPKGIPIGTVRESTRGMESNKQYVVVEPLADFEHVEYVVVLRYRPEAEDVQGRDDTGDLTYTPLDTAKPVPTVQIGSDFYQLAPTPEPTPEPSPTVIIGEDGEEIVVTPAPSSTGSENYEYQIPSGGTDTSYGFTLSPTDSPTPTPPPLDMSVEEDE